MRRADRSGACRRWWRGSQRRCRCQDRRRRPPERNQSRSGASWRHPATQEAAGHPSDAASPPLHAQRHASRRAPVPAVLDRSPGCSRPASASGCRSSPHGGAAGLSASATARALRAAPPRARRWCAPSPTDAGGRACNDAATNSATTRHWAPYAQRRRRAWPPNGGDRQARRRWCRGEQDRPGARRRQRPVVWPPSTTRAWPTVNPPRPEHSHSTAEAISSGRPIRPIGS